MARNVRRRLSSVTEESVLQALDDFAIELPSWGFANTGTRFGKFLQPAAACTIEEKLADAGVCHALTGACPTVALHVLWDFDTTAEPAAAAKAVRELATRHGVAIGSINPNLFQDQAYKLGSLASPDAKVRKQAIEHVLACIRLARAVGSKTISLWLADGTNYPGQDNLRRRKRALQEGLVQIHEALPRDLMLLVEYKPFEPAFYHTDIADWGMAATYCRHAGKRARVLVDTGHHLPGANIEHIVAFLLDEGLLGGFHFNDRKYADDDLTMGSIDPYAAFRIFNAIFQHGFDTGEMPQIAYMVDQSHNLKPKIEAMIQTVCMAQSLLAKARLVDREALASAQKRGDIVAAERRLVEAFDTDVRPLLDTWRRQRHIPPDPLDAYRASGHQLRLERDRTERRKAAGPTAATAAYA